jgi:ABC-type dipeptide/oligopeptide/nickel transport system permease subunit
LAEPAAVEVGAFGVSRSPTRQALRRLGRNRLAVGSSVFLLAVGAMALLAPLIDRYPPEAMLFDPLVGPSSEHWFGTDNLGRDIWSRVVHGARVSLVVGLASQAIAFAIGVSVGAAAGFAGGLIDSALMRATDVMQALPSVLLALLFLTVMGPSTTVLVIAIGLATWAVIARVVRAQVLAEKELPYVEAAYSVGCSSTRTLIRHVLPNVLGPAIVLVTFGIPQAIFTEAFLSFIGLGPPPPNPSWGRLLADSFQYVQTSAHFLIFPCLALSATLLAFNFLGDGARDAFDPYDTR